MVMLSRVADSLFWMGRYLERSEQLARQLTVTRDLLVDLAEPDPSAAQTEWKALLGSLKLPNTAMERLVFDATEPFTLAGCVGQARENARQVREVITNEMWEEVNRIYWTLIEARDGEHDETAISTVLSDVLAMTAAWDGLIDGSLSRDEAFVFLKLGKWIERLNASTSTILARGNPANRAPENVALVVLLKSLGAIEAYRKVSPTHVEFRDTLEFLVFRSSFPRSLCFCATAAKEMIQTLDRDCRGSNPAISRSFGRMVSKIVHSDVDEVMTVGLEVFLEGVLVETKRGASMIERQYFLQ